MCFYFLIIILRQFHCWVQLHQYDLIHQISFDLLSPISLGLRRRRRRPDDDDVNGIEDGDKWLPMMDPPIAPKDDGTVPVVSLLLLDDDFKAAAVWLVDEMDDVGEEFDSVTTLDCVVLSVTTIS